MGLGQKKKNMDAPGAAARGTAAARVDLLMRVTAERVTTAAAVDMVIAAIFSFCVLSCAGTAKSGV